MSNLSLHAPQYSSTPPQPPYSDTVPTPPDVTSVDTSGSSSSKFKIGFAVFCFVIAGLYAYGMHMDVTQVQSTSKAADTAAITTSVESGFDDN